VISKGGRPEDGTDPKNINMTEMLVDLKPESAWRKGVTKEHLVREMEDKLNDMPGIEPTFSQPVRDQILESISQIDGQIVIKLFGDDVINAARPTPTNCWSDRQGARECPRLHRP
jgi:cobalt-zinc-cadmium resistance protein CzcA